MTDKKAKVLVWIGAIFLVLAGFGLYKLFDYQGFGEKKENKLVNYNVSDYIEIVPLNFNDLSDVYKKINISRVSIKNINSSLTKPFLNMEDELVNYIMGYYNEIKENNSFTDINEVSSFINYQINSTILSIYYEIDFVLDSNMFDNNIRSYFISFNYDLRTDKVLSSDDLLLKYNYSKEKISEKLYKEDVRIKSDEVVIDKNTNISLTQEDIERKKDEYINRIISEFDNIITVYESNKELVLVYDKKELLDLFFEDDINSEIKTKFIK